MNVSFEIPQDIEEQVRREAADLNSEARETYLVELYRQEWITQHQLAEALGSAAWRPRGYSRHRVSSASGQYGRPSRGVAGGIAGIEARMIVVSDTTPPRLPHPY